MLDEIDKIGHDFRGDPAAALLEVLDPEQNNTFADHYLEIPFDLSNVMFVATANVADPIPPPLRDRMEILEIPGYTRREKLAIAREHLIPKQLEEHGLTKEHAADHRRGASKPIIDHYTREAGVRTLERQIASVIRGVAVKVAEGDLRPVQDRKRATACASSSAPPRFTSEVAERTAEPGVATGLAWTRVGGEILFIEATRMHGTGKLQLTGQLGDVMKESAQAALSLRPHATPRRFGIPKDFLEKSDLHIHIPAGAHAEGRPVARASRCSRPSSRCSPASAVRHDVAMTGEITLRGRVLPVGGIKEKVLAAHRAGIKRVILPERNKADLEEVPQEVRDELEFHPVQKMEDVLRFALTDARQAQARRRRKGREEEERQERVRATSRLSQRTPLFPSREPTDGRVDETRPFLSFRRANRRRFATSGQMGDMEKIKRAAVLALVRGARRSPKCWRRTATSNHAVGAQRPIPIREINEQHENPKYLPGIALPDEPARAPTRSTERSRAPTWSMLVVPFARAARGRQSARTRACRVGVPIVNGHQGHRERLAGAALADPREHACRRSCTPSSRT